MFDPVPKPILLHDGERVLRANKSAASLFRQATPDDLYGMALVDLLAFESRELARARLDRLKFSPRDILPTALYTFMRQDGSAFVAEVDTRDYRWSTPLGGLLFWTHIKFIRDLTL